MTKRISTSSKIALAVALSGLPVHAYGQETKPSDEEQSDQAKSAEANEAEAPADEPIIVTGFRSSNTAAIAAKRDSDLIIDAISQDEAGLLPDLTISDIARRLPGAATVSLDGPSGIRSVNTETNVTIRGLSPSFNLTTFDGVPIASTDEDERAADLSIIPPTMIRRLEAVKTLTSDLNPHGLSGQLNLVTASAFTLGERSLNTRFSVGDNSTAGEGVNDQGLNFRGSATYSDVFGTSDDFGIVIAASYDRFYETSLDYRPGATTSTYTYYNEAGREVTSFEDSANGFVASRRQRHYFFETEISRASGVVKLEYSPSTETYASLLGGIFYEEEKEDANQYLVAGLNRAPIDQTATTGTFVEGSIIPTFIEQPQESETRALIGTFRHNFEQQGRLEFLASYSRADVDNGLNAALFLDEGGNETDTAYSYDLSSGEPVVTFLDPAAVVDFSNWNSLQIQERGEDLQQDLAYLSGNFSWNFEREDRGFGFRVGASYLYRDQQYNQDYLEGDVFNTAGCDEADITNCPLATFDAYVRPQTVEARGVNTDFYLIDFDAFYGDWVAQGSPLTNDRTDNAIASDYDLQESIFGAFAQASYRSDRLFVIAGLRYDNTQADINLFAQDDSLIPGHVQDSDYFVPVSRENDYDFFLPSVVGAFSATDNLLLRAGYSQTIGRPNFSELAIGERINVPVPPVDGDDLGTITITRGNPDLRPLKSNNFDFSAEYYFDNGASLVSAAVFYKDVDDQIYTQRTNVSGFEFEGVLYDATIVQPVNATSSSIQGLELALRKDFKNTLPAPFDGFILNANVTFLDSEFTFLDGEGVSRELPGWENQPDFIANVQLAYEKGPFGANLGFNHVGDFFSRALDASADTTDLYREARSVFDLQVRYEFNDSFQVLAEVQNLTEEGVEYSRRFPDGTSLLGADVQRGRVVWLGFTWRPNIN